MKATLEAFLQSLQKLSREQLIQKLVQMKENEMNQSVILTEMRNTSTVMTRDYSKAQESNIKIKASNRGNRKTNSSRAFLRIIPRALSGSSRYIFFPSGLDGLSERNLE